MRLSNNLIILKPAIILHILAMSLSPFIMNFEDYSASHEEAHLVMFGYIIYKGMQKVLINSIDFLVLAL